MSRTSPTDMVIRQRLLALSRSLPGAKKGDPGRLHQARVATRRLREALPVVAGGPKGRKLVRDVRRLTRAFGPVRELDMVLQTLDELAAEGGVPAGAIAKLRQVIRHERRRMHEEMCRRVDRVSIDKLRKRASAAQPRDRGPERLTDARRRAARRGERLRAAIENAAAIYLPDRLHEVRLALKKLRYSLELTRELSGSRATARLKTLKEAQDLLGRMNDLEVLIARVRAVQGSGKVPDLRLSSDLDVVVRRLETECRQVHGQYIASRRKLLAICDHAAAAADGKRGAVRAA
ncbi:MAG: CHAD domain-containing protein [Gemmatimonadetes bacterium]|nr:CHAD domain-containing protein [Gemmatimonadota bacterium]